VDIGGLPQRQRSLGLPTTCELSPSAAEAGALALLYERLSTLSWSTDIGAVEHVLAYLRADLAATR